MLRNELWAALRRCGLPLLAVATAVALSAAQTVSATTAYQEITSAGPLSAIWLGNDLSCQVLYAGDVANEFFPSSSAPGDCGTFVSLAGKLYGPNFSTDSATATPFAGLASYIPFTVATQSSVTGSGIAASPFSVSTAVSAGGLVVGQTDTYVTGATSYRTDVTLRNAGGLPVSGRLYRAADCYLQGTDSGFGEINPANNAPACTPSANNSPPGPLEELAPLTGGNHYVEGLFSTVWQDIANQTDLPNTCDCTTNEDNGAGINWDFSIPAGQSETFSMLTNFSAGGALAGTPLAQSPPSITGTPIVGDSLTESHGVWSGNPTGYAQQWQDCDPAGAGCTSIAGATGPSYTLRASDAGHTVRVLETASNGNGAGLAVASAATAVVQPASVAPRAPVTLATTQTSGAINGPSLTVPAGTTGETDRATLAGANVAAASGSIAYTLYSSSSCTASSAVFHSAVTASGPIAPGSSPVGQVLVPGRYYWQASYGGDPRNGSAPSGCGAEILTMTAPASAAGSATATAKFVKLKVRCAIVPCQLKLVLTATEKVAIKGAVTRVTHKKPRFRTQSVTIATDSLRITTISDVAVEAPLTPRGKRYLAVRHRAVKLKLTLSETIKGTRLVTESPINVGIAKG